MMMKNGRYWDLLIMQWLILRIGSLTIGYALNQVTIVSHIILLRHVQLILVIVATIFFFFADDVLVIL